MVENHVELVPCCHSAPLKLSQQTWKGGLSSKNSNVDPIGLAHVSSFPQRRGRVDTDTHTHVDFWLTHVLQWLTTHTHTQSPPLHSHTTWQRSYSHSQTHPHTRSLSVFHKAPDSTGNTCMFESKGERRTERAGHVCASCSWHACFCCVRAWVCVREQEREINSNLPAQQRVHVILAVG